MTKSPFLIRAQAIPAAEEAAERCECEPAEEAAKATDAAQDAADARRVVRKTENSSRGGVRFVS